MSRSQQVKREPITDRDFVMPFGQYKGETIANIMADRPDYLAWLHNNTDFELGWQLLEEVETSYEQAAREARLPSRLDR